MRVAARVDIRGLEHGVPPEGHIDKTIYQYPFKASILGIGFGARWHSYHHMTIIIPHLIKLSPGHTEEMQLTGPESAPLQAPQAPPSQRS